MSRHHHQKKRRNKDKKEDKLNKKGDESICDWSILDGILTGTPIRYHTSGVSVESWMQYANRNDMINLLGHGLMSNPDRLWENYLGLNGARINFDIIIDTYIYVNRFLKTNELSYPEYFTIGTGIGTGREFASKK